MRFFRVMWGVDVIAAAIAVAFFLIGIADGSVSSFNMLLWLGLLGGIGLVVFGSRALSRSGRNVAAIALASVLAVPTLLFGLMMAVMIFGGARWN